MTIYWYGNPEGKGSVAGVAIKKSNAINSTTVVSSNHAVVSITAVARGDENGPYPGTNQWIRLPDGRETQSNQWLIMKDYIVNELRICTVDRPITDNVLELAPVLSVGTQVKAFSNITRTWNNYKISYISKDIDGNARIVFDGPPAQVGDSGGPVLTQDNKFIGSIMSSWTGGMVATTYPGVYGGVDPVPAPASGPSQPVSGPTTSGPVTSGPATSPSIITSGPAINPTVISTDSKPIAIYEKLLNNLSIVDSVQELISFNPSKNETVQTLGYYKPGDGGGGTYIWSDNQENINNGNKIRSEISGSWILSQNNNSVNVLQWGVKNDGSYDASVRINEAIINTSNFIGVREIYIPKGIYSIGSPINIAQNNTKIKLHGTLRNINGINSSVLEIYTKQTPTINNGIPTYQLSNIIIDGEGIGCIDQNSQNATSWDFENPSITKAYHALFAFNIDTLTIKNLTVKNGIMWSVCAELSRNVSITDNKVYTGFCNNRRVGGVFKYLGCQDGIHAVDCNNTIITNNYVESGDDAVVVSATRSLAGNAVVSNNICSVKVFAYEKDGITLNNNSVTGRFPLAIYCESITNYCGLENVVVSNNVVPGGQGLFACYDIDKRSNTTTPRIGVLNGVRFTGNSFNNIDSPGNPNVKPYPVQMGWFIKNGNNIEFDGNTFNNIARWGNISFSNSSVNIPTVVFRNNRFTNYNPPLANLFPSQTPSILWLANGNANMIVENNTFENNNVTAIAIGSTGDITPNKFNIVSINNNTFTNNKSCLESYGANAVTFKNNTVNTSKAPIVLGRSYKIFKVQNNLVIGSGNGALNIASSAWNVANNYPTTEMLILDNSVYDNYR
jgi:hypothetical protein